MKASDLKRKKPPTMYYKRPEDRELLREGDVDTEDSADPMLTDGYGPDADIPEEDPFALPGEGKMPPSDRSVPLAGPLPGLAGKLRKRGVPGRGK